MAANFHHHLDRVNRSTSLAWMVSAEACGGEKKEMVLELLLRALCVDQD